MVINVNLLNLHDYGKMVGCPIDGPRPILGTDVDALRRVLEHERPTDGESTR